MNLYQHVISGIDDLEARLSESDTIISELRDIVELQLDTIAHQAEIIVKREREITALKKIIQQDTPASVIDENSPMTWRDDVERVAFLQKHFGHDWGNHL